jgi:hypothetical protein
VCHAASELVESHGGFLFGCSSPELEARASGRAATLFCSEPSEVGRGVELLLSLIVRRSGRQSMLEEGMRSSLQWCLDNDQTL